MYIVLMAGGLGTRFWPRSRQNLPKQLLKLFGERSMLQNTYDRIKGLTTDNKILVITGENLQKEVIKQLPELPAENIIAEPFGKNTAPCIGLATAIINKREKNNNTVMAVLPADHLVSDDFAFKQLLRTAADYSQESGSLMTIGIKPSYPEIGYGYIQRGEKSIQRANYTISPVKTFAEKPNLDTAKRFIKSGDFFWNSGIFVWTISSILKEIEKQMSDLFEMLPDLTEKIDTNEMAKGILKVYSSTKSISIDYAIMEGAENVSVIDGGSDWNDVGSWEAVYNLSTKIKNENSVDTAKSVIIDSKNNYFYSQNKKLIAAIDVENLILVETNDAILICKKESSQRVKEIVDKLRFKEMEEYL